MKLNAVLKLFPGSALMMVAVACLPAAAPTGILSDAVSTNVVGGSGAYAPSLSADGRYVVFLSHAKNLTTNSSLTPYLDVFVHDLVTSNTTLVSVNHFGSRSGSEDSAFCAISSTGRFIAFAGDADNLVPGDTNGTSDVFVRDVQGGTSLVSIGLEGGSAAPKFSVGASGFLTVNYQLSRSPAISADGRWVVFESAATNLVALRDTNAATDIFIRDLQTGATRLLSVSAAGDSAASASSELPSLSADARRVAFVSYATDIVTGGTNTRGDIYVRDLDADTTAWASTNVASYFTNGIYRCYAPVLSRNGEVVAFKVAAPNASSGLLFRIDLSSSAVLLLNSNSPVSTSLSLSDDGRFLAHDDGTNVYVWDQQAGADLLASARFDGSGLGNGLSLSPVLSANGKTVVFVSAATDLVTDQGSDTNEVFQIYARDLQTGVTRLLTTDSQGQPVQANHLLANISLSADGTRVAFDSRSGDLVPGDGNRDSDVFVTDLVENTTRLVSRRAESRPSVTAARHARIAPDCVSTNGQYLLFASVLKTSELDDPVCCENLFIRDLVTGGEEQITDFDVVEPKEFVLSANARHVAYITRGIVGPRDESVVLLNRDTGVRVVVNIDPFTGGLLTGGFRGLTLSPAGDRVAYVTSAASTDSGLLYMFESLAATNRRMAPFAAAYTARFSPDGRRLVFGQASGDPFYGGLVVYDILTNGASVIRSTNVSTFARPHSFSADSRYLAVDQSRLDIFDLQSMTRRTFETDIVRNPVLSANGAWVAYEDSAYYGKDGAFEITVRNLQNGVTKLATRNLSGTGSGNGRSKSVGLSSDARFVIFSSRASDLVPDDTNALSDVFAYDVITGTTFLLSGNRDGTSSGNASSTMPILGADGRTVIFQSLADDLVPGDYNFASDIFIARLGGIDSDGDGMDDDWEMAYFESLARNGGGDWDGDGTTDRQEFLAGTDPTNLGSVLRVITVAPMSGGQRTILWASAPGRAYRVQFKDDVDAATWTDLPGTVTAAGSTASMVDASVSLAHRYYRVILP